MTEQEFWAMIDRNVSESDEEQTEALATELRRSTVEDVVDFSAHSWRAIDAMYDWNLWGAAYFAMGGCSDDGFEYFRAYLVCRGRDVCEAVRRDPDALVEHLLDDPEEMCFECLLVVPWNVYEEKTGKELPMPERTTAEFPRGQQWDFEDSAEARRRFPRLFARLKAIEDRDW